MNQARTYLRISIFLLIMLGVLSTGTLNAQTDTLRTFWKNKQLQAEVILTLDTGITPPGFILRNKKCFTRNGDPMSEWDCDGIIRSLKLDTVSNRAEEKSKPASTYTRQGLLIPSDSGQIYLLMQDPSLGPQLYPVRLVDSLTGNRLVVEDTVIGYRTYVFQVRSADNTWLGAIRLSQEKFWLKPANQEEEVLLIDYRKWARSQRGSIQNMPEGGELTISNTEKWRKHVCLYEEGLDLFSSRGWRLLFIGPEQPSEP